MNAVLRDALGRWLFRLRGPEAAPIVLTQRRVFVLPTRHGLLFGAAALMMLLGSINYTLSLGYMLAFLLAGLGVVAILHTFRNLAQLEIAPGRCEPAFAGESCAFGLVLDNRRDEPRPALALSAGGGEAVIATVPPRAGICVTLALPARSRGWLAPGRITVETRYPLGLVRAWSYVEPDMRCLVYPAPEADPPALPLAGHDYVDGSAGGSGGDDFAGLRGYQPADSPRHIAWKAVARDGPPLTKQFAGGSPGQVWLDWFALPDALDTEARLSRLTAWLLTAQRQGLAFGLRLPGVEFAPGGDEAHTRACLKALALHGRSRR